MGHVFRLLDRIDKADTVQQARDYANQINQLVVVMFGHYTPETGWTYRGRMQRNSSSNMGMLGPGDGSNP